ncbi:MAG: TIM barrel protein [Bryobacteraceae bacterium]
MAPLLKAAGRRIRLGGPVFLQSDDPEELAREHRRLGYSAATCPKATAGDTDRVRAITKAFAGQDVAIAEVGAWVNLLDPDSEKRSANLKYVTDRLALAEAVAARCCVDIAGSYNATAWYGLHPKNYTREAFDATVENCRKVIDAIKPMRTKFSIEMQVGLQPRGLDGYLQLIKAVDRTSFGVHLDVCNGIDSPEKFYNNGAYIRECFQKLGPWVLSCHAKDLAWVPDGYNLHFAEVIPGRGEMDYRAYLGELAKMPIETPLLLEHLKGADQYEEGKRHILKVGADLGITFA